MRQTAVPLNRDLAELEALPQPIVAYGRELAAGQSLAFHRHRRAQLVGASKRTLSRLFTTQTRMSFQAWRQQRRLLRALELLATGDNVTAIALELGYDNTSAFIAMFRRCLGTTPARYLNTTGQ